jgi:hypothetical protein
LKSRTRLSEIKTAAARFLFALEEGMRAIT